MYAQYQTLLDKLLSEGTLLAIASKNEDVKVPFEIIQPKIGLDKFFPVEANWGPKSESVARILKTWNISADDVLFIDDSDFELAEVFDSHPGIKVLKFPKKEEDFPNFVKSVRHFFPKREATEEDKLRMQSIRSNVWFNSELQTKDPEEFYQGLNAKITFSAINETNIDRAVELINKTNQFNLNGWRTDKERLGYLLSIGHNFGYVVSYEDRFGPLGIIAVFTGEHDYNTTLHNYMSLSHFCLSCRAFSRRIEYAILRELFKFTRTLHFNYQKTEKNGSFVTYYSGLTQDSFLDDVEFEKLCPKLYHEVKFG